MESNGSELNGMGIFVKIFVRHGDEGAAIIF